MARIVQAEWLMDVVLALVIAGAIGYGLIRALRFVIPLDHTQRQKAKDKKAESVTLNSADVEVRFFEIAHWLKKDKDDDE